MLAAGKLDRRITIERRSVTRSTSGEESESWATLAEVWAHKLPITGREFYAAGAAHVSSEETARFRIRYLAGLSAQDRIVEGGKTWNVVNVAELGRADGVELTAQAVGQS